MHRVIFSEKVILLCSFIIFALNLPTGQYHTAKPYITAKLYISPKANITAKGKAFCGFESLLDSAATKKRPSQSDLNVFLLAEAVGRLTPIRRSNPYSIPQQQKKHLSQSDSGTIFVGGSGGIRTHGTVRYN